MDKFVKTENFKFTGISHPCKTSLTVLNGPEQCSKISVCTEKVNEKFSKVFKFYQGYFTLGETNGDK